ncbi:beta-phosphoglucomutase [Helicovermis profundi]|uniref:Beta-phosphoglucomutase n=1 Tax=Helicovermis profundi TaxID=3065157 RepID=A0AAU9EEU5_9FIRM|nr:beta-phosphoglucomutase [Clostridia bacterium S502]
MIKLVVFDLDGVITETSEQHFIAWKTLADSKNIVIDREFNESLKGVSRYDSIVKILKYGNVLDDYSKEEVKKLMKIKNDNYVKLISKFNEDNINGGVEDLFIYFKKNNIKIAIGSASRNAPFLIKNMKLDVYIDYIVNPLNLDGKPSPDIFLDAANHFGISPTECIGIEDAISGIKAINTAGMISIGIGDKKILKDADYVYDSIGEIDYKVLEEMVK